MPRYRVTAPLLPGLLLLLLPALAAYPWQLPFGSDLALPMLGLLTAFFCALRYPGLLLSPIIFLAGLACDLFTRAPLGYWALLFMAASICAALAATLAERYGALIGWLCLLVMAPLAAGAAWGLSSLYMEHWLDIRAISDGLLMALILLPLPILLLIGLEPLLMLRTDRV